MRRLGTAGLIIVAVVITSILTACATTVVQTLASQPTGGDYALNNQNQLFWDVAKAVGWHQPHYSTEIANLLVRNMRLNNPNHKSYIYLYANNGSIKGFFPVIGKCTAMDSSATSLWHASPRAGNNDTTDGNHFGGNDSTGVAVDSPQLDGSYGNNEAGMFCYVDKPGHPMIQFNGEYLWSDQFIALSSTPQLVLTKVENHGSTYQKYEVTLPKKGK